MVYFRTSYRCPKDVTAGERICSAVYAGMISGFPCLYVVWCSGECLRLFFHLNSVSVSN